MDLYYTCRHCQSNIGMVREQSATWQQLGFHRLSASDYHDLIRYDANGNMHVQVICEDCEEALQHNPSLHGIDYIIQ
ncbi:anti-sigma-F factor Fin family protein [Bacillus sp. AGMB 02131]|uniref:Anti-sigma-F factor Fin family protein n=1 Tax=Peribacillus faecalis TaxID=2772559 RepID=A0A927CZU4_9BACI|nr:anti-sigma-F factor Fin family protein [Peribacillus faecalis]MBD3108970.1 anti-sigma-F factor Fin family protein [Peribacillus faecalis]